MKELFDRIHCFFSSKRRKQRNKERILTQLISTPEGLQRLAAAMVSPIRRPLDYRGVMRRALVVEPIPEGALPVYPEFDPNISVEDAEKIIEAVKIVHSLGSNAKMKFIIKMMEEK